MPTVLDPSPLSTLTKEYFSKPQQRIVKGIEIKIIPMPKDIPILEKQDFDEINDKFRAIFFNTGELIHKKVDDQITFLTDAKTGYFAGFIVSGLKRNKISTIQISFEKKLDDLKVALMEKLNAASVSDFEKAISEYDQNDRRISFFKGLMSFIQKKTATTSTEASPA